MYLVAVLDWFSRYVVSWELDQTLAQPFVLRAVEQALAQATPLISNSFLCTCGAPRRMKMRVHYPTAHG